MYQSSNDDLIDRMWPWRGGSRPKRIYYWVGITVSVNFNSGLQRVARCLGRALEQLGNEIIPVKASGKRVVPLERNEAMWLARWGGPGPRVLPSLPQPSPNDVLLIPELVSPLQPAGSSPMEWAKKHGMRSAAIFFDMIPLHHREIYPDHVVQALIGFWRAFSELDLAIPISRTVEADLKNFLLFQGLPCPPIQSILLPGEMPGVPRNQEARSPRDGEPFHLVAIGTWEPRKNYPRLIRALGLARQKGADVRLTIIGRTCKEQFPELDAEIKQLAGQVGNDAVSLNYFLEDAEMSAILRRSHATIFGSWLEGFGLPVMESIWNGLPCICHNGSSIAEIAPGGGTVMVDMTDVNAIASAITSVASDRGLYAQLVREAIERPVKSWAHYGAEVDQVLPKVHSPFDYNPFGW